MKRRTLPVAFKAAALVCLIVAWAVPAARNARAEQTASQSPSHKRVLSKRLLLDDRIIEQVDHATLSLGTVQKSERNPLFGEDKSWEPRYDNMYPSVIYDDEEKLFKCWYTPFVISELDAKTPRNERKNVKWNVSERRFGLCYATSPDGLKWEKPELGLVELQGSKKNNILLMDVHGADIIKDSRDPDSQRRYKMFGTLGGLGPHMVWFSADGLHWSEPIKLDIGGRSDTHNNVFWSDERKEYVGITRLGFVPRNVGRTSSSDFVHWSPIQEIVGPTAGQPDLHDMDGFAYGGVYFGLIGVYDVEAGKQWVELAWSPDTLKWSRIAPGTAFLPNSSTPGEYDWGCIFATRPIVKDDQVLLYYAGCNGKFFDWRDGFLCLATLSPDHWAGYRSEQGTTGAVLTKPMTLSTTNLGITADAQNGNVTVQILDQAGKKLAESEPLKGDSVNQQARWKGAVNGQDFVGKEVRLRFAIDNATIYSFAFLE